MKRAVLELKKRLPETTFVCLSNSNEVYIGTILEVSVWVTCHRGIGAMGVTAI